MGEWATELRPRTLDELVGQEANKAILKRWIDTNTLPNAIILYGRSGSGKTTTARLLATALNADYIELDAASNNKVEDARGVNELASRLSLHGNHKIFCVDECVTGDTEVLTDRGFVPFNELKNTDKVAQYSKEGEISFVIPTEVIRLPYTGEAFKVTNKGRKGNENSFIATPNHVQPLFDRKSGSIQEEYLKDLKFKQKYDMIVAGTGATQNSESAFSPLDILAVAVQADANPPSKVPFSHNGEICYKFEIGFKRERKQRRFKQILDSLSTPEAKEEWNIDWHYTEKRNSYIIWIPTRHNITKVLSTRFHYTFSFERAKAFVTEVMEWGGSYKSGYDFYYSSTIKENRDLVQSAMVQAGIRTSAEELGAHEKIINSRKKPTAATPLYSVAGQNKAIKNTQYTLKESIQISETVYCVKVPTNMFVARMSTGQVFITGNCHMLTMPAWNALLKTIEEPNSTTHFILCSTEFHKLPATIRGRSRMLKFYTLSREDLTKLAKDTLVKHNESLPEEVVELIISQSRGQARDLLKLLQSTIEAGIKTKEELSKFLAIPERVGMGSFVKSVCSGNSKMAVKVLESINSDLVEWSRECIEFIYSLYRDKYSIEPLRGNETTVLKLQAIASEISDVQLGKLTNELLKIDNNQTAYGMLFSLACTGV